MCSAPRTSTRYSSLSTARTSVFTTVWGRSTQATSATPSVASPISAISWAMLRPSFSSTVATRMASTVTPALTMLLAARMRERSSSGLRVCKMA